MSEQATKKASLVFIFITVLLDMLALGVIVPILPKLIEDFLGGDAVKTAEILGVFGTIFALMQFVFSPILGVLSDRFGRRPIILISNFGLGLDYIFMCFAPTLSWLFVGRVISGITAASIPAASGYIADVTPPEKRSAGFGMLGMAFGVGFILGPALGGFFGEINPRLPFGIAAGLSLLNALYGYFILPESLKPENRVNFSWKRANPIASIGMLASKTKLLELTAVNFLISITHVIFPSVMVLYLSYRYGWSVGTVGYMLAAVGLTNGIVQGVLITPSVKKFGERNVLLIGLVFGIIGFGISGWAPTGAWFWWSVPFLALWGLANAVIQGLMSQHVADNEQGRLQGAIGSMRGIAELIGPALFTLTFAYFIKKDAPIYFPGAPFILAGLLLAAALGVAFLTMSHPERKAECDTPGAET